MIEVYIPSVGPERLSTEKARTVFKVDVLCNGRKHSLQRRYSEFHALHKTIKKACKVPDFPPKRVPNWMPKVLEQRRQALEAYIQGVLWENQDVPKEVLEFLKLRHFQQTQRNCSINSLPELMPQENRSHPRHCCDWSTTRDLHTRHHQQHTRHQQQPPTDIS